MQFTHVYRFFCILLPIDNHIKLIRMLFFCSINDFEERETGLLWFCLFGCLLCEVSFLGLPYFVLFFFYKM